MVDLMQQNQKLTREVNRHRRQRYGKEHGQNLENERAENGAERGDHSRGTVTRRVPHLEREMDQMKRAMEEMKDSMRRVNHMDDPFIGLILPLSRPSQVIPYPSNSKCLPWTHMMECGTLAITLQCSRRPCTSKVFQMKSCAKPFLPRWKAQPEYGLVNYR